MGSCRQVKSAGMPMALHQFSYSVQITDCDAKRDTNKHKLKPRPPSL